MKGKIEAQKEMKAREKEEKEIVAQQVCSYLPIYVIFCHGKFEIFLIQSTRSIASLY